MIFFGCKQERLGVVMDLQIGDIVSLKKQHPCGSNDWELLRVGMDFRLKCCGCGHMVMLPRKQVERSIRKVAKKNPDSRDEG